jgi:hypothetical protein
MKGVSLEEAEKMLERANWIIQDALSITGDRQ